MQAAKIEMRHLPAVDRFSVLSVRVVVANFFFGQSIGIDETNTFQLKFLWAPQAWAVYGR